MHHPRLPRCRFPASVAVGRLCHRAFSPDRSQRRGDWDPGHLQSHLRPGRTTMTGNEGRQRRRAPGGAGTPEHFQLARLRAAARKIRQHGTWSVFNALNRAATGRRRPLSPRAGGQGRRTAAAVGAGCAHRRPDQRHRDPDEPARAQRDDRGRAKREAGRGPSVVASDMKKPASDVRRAPQEASHLIATHGALPDARADAR